MSYVTGITELVKREGGGGGGGDKSVFPALDADALPLGQR